ncbi:Uncharacterised protein [Chlamydia trachomatis]|nr:Uncharacterised protein [Chlamydia trachomatis]
MLNIVLMSRYDLQESAFYYRFHQVRSRHCLRYVQSINHRQEAVSLLGQEKQFDPGHAREIRSPQNSASVFP